MPRIKLAYWHGEHAPGEEIDVSGEELHALTRDGRVAEVLPEPGVSPSRRAAPEPAPQPETEAPASDESGRKRR